MGQRLVHAQYLKVSRSDINAYSFTNGTVVYSDPIKADLVTGYASLLAEITGTGNLDISFEVSLDGETFFDPKNTSGSSVGVIRTGLTTSEWIIFSPRVAKWVRFKVDPDADTVATLRYLHQEE